MISNDGSLCPPVQQIEQTLNICQRMIKSAAQGEKYMGKCIIIGAGACDTKLLDQRLVVKNEDLCIAADSTNFCSNSL